MKFFTERPFWGIANARSSTLRLGMLALITVVILNSSLATQQPQQHEERSVNTPSLKVETDLVSFNVTVTDGHNEPVRGLKQENFRVFEDGVEQPIQHFGDDDYPYCLGLDLDRSGSMYSVIDDVYKAAFHTIRASKPDDEFFVITFN